MADIKFDCAHCGTKNSGGTVLAITGWPKEPSTHVFAKCNYCGGPTYFVMEPKHGIGSESFYNTGGSQFRDILTKIKYSEIFLQMPKPMGTAAPAHTPDAIAEQFAQSVIALNSGAWNPAAMGFRAALDFASKQLGGDHTNLRPRLKELNDRGVIPDTLHDWANQLALDGNAAAHDIPPSVEHSKARAQELADYTRLFLIYAYEMPGRVAERKAAADQLKAAAQPEAAQPSTA